MSENPAVTKECALGELSDPRFQGRNSPLAVQFGLLASFTHGMDAQGLASLLRLGRDAIAANGNLTALAQKAETSAREVALNLGDRYVSNIDASIAPLNQYRDSIIDQLQSELDGDLWVYLGSMWKELSFEFGAKQPDDNSEREPKIIAVALGLAKLERNLIAGLEEYQDEAMSVRPRLLAILKVRD